MLSRRVSPLGGEDAIRAAMVVHVPRGSSLAGAIRSLHKNGGHLILEPSQWTLYGNHIITANNVSIDARGSLFKCAPVCDGRVFTVQGDGFRWYGGTVDDDNAGSHFFQLEGDDALITGVRFKHCHQAVKMAGSSHHRIIGNWVELTRNRATAISWSGTGAFGSISNNVISSGTAQDIDLGAAVTKVAMAGNAVGTLRYYGANQCAEAANTGTVTVV